MIARIVAALVGLALLIPLLLWGGSLAVQILVPVVITICLMEYAAMAFPKGKGWAWLWLMCATGAGYGVVLYSDPAIGLIDAARIPGVFALVILAAFLAALFYPGAELSKASDRVGRLLMGCFWVGLLVFLPLLRVKDAGLTWVFLTLVISWSSDTGAYFSGRFFGRRKLYERISPKKTWEGFWGGIVACVLCVFIVNAVAAPGLTPVDCVVIGLVAGSLGVLGDLSESLLKRSFGVKDSGKIMPGHGGLLDRIDSVLFVCPSLFVDLWIVKGV